MMSDVFFREMTLPEPAANLAVGSGSHATQTAALMTGLETVFDKFVQSSKSNTGAGGTGLGLAICREIIHLHRGRIWAENRDGGGARFVFEIPIQTEVATATTA